MVFQTLSYKALALLGMEDDLNTINKIFGEIDTINAEIGGVDDILEIITKSPSPYSESLYQGREIKIAVSDKNRSRFNGFLPGTGMEQVEIVTFGFLLTFYGEQIKEVAGTTAHCVDIIKMYRNYLHEHRIIMEARLNIAKFRAGISSI